ncbi:MAG TPA: class I SAM-dependent methyltransferase [bacterium]|nr:class I SAM-dependent methyltransferase [bacterium]
MSDLCGIEGIPEKNSHPIGEETLRRIYRMRRMNEWMWSRIEPWVGNRILEGGCGNGNITEFLLTKEFVLSADINPTNLQALQARFRDHENLSVLNLDLTHPALKDCAVHRFDTVVCLNVLEHIERHETVLQSFHHILQPDGLLVLLVPAYPWLFGTLDSALGHVRRYGKAELKTLLEQAGFRIVHHSYLNMMGILGWWLNGKLLKRDLLPSAQLDLYEGLVPLFRCLEQITRHSMGLSHIIIGAKSGP